MRRPRRETQIFSLSMMDVISGAMGAFLIIMVVLMRYYKEDEEITAQREQLQRQLQDIRRQVDEAIQQLQNTTDVDIEELLRRLEALKQQLAEAERQMNRLNNDLQAARSRVNQLESQNKKLSQQKRQLEQEKEELDRKLRYRQPFVVLAIWDAPKYVDVDIVVEDNVPIKELGNKVRFFHPDKKVTSGWPGQATFDGGGDSYAEAWLTRDSEPGYIHKVYVVLRSNSLARTTVEAAVAGEGYLEPFGKVQLTPTKRWELVGILTTDDSGKTTARKTTESERRKDRREVEARLLQQRQQQKKKKKPGDN